MDNFVLGALLQQARAVKARSEDEYYRERQARSLARPARFLVGIAVAGLVLSIFGLSVA